MPTTLVRAGTRAAMRAPVFYGNAGQYVRAARLIQAAWRHRRGIKRAGRVLYRGMKYAKRRRTGKWGKRTVPNASAKSQAKQSPMPVGDLAGFPMGQLQLVSLPWPSFGDGITQRERNMMRFKGVKICRYFRYDFGSGSPNNIGPIELHWALLQYKAPTTPLSGTFTDFFRTHESDTTRSTDFPEYTAISQWDMMLNCAAINPERYKVITHRRFILDAYENQERSKSVKKFNGGIRIEKYFKFNKIMNFRNSSDGTPDNNIFEAYWYNTSTPFLFPTNPIAVNYLRTQHSHTMYYADMRK